MADVDQLHQKLLELRSVLGERSDPTDSVKFQGKLGVWRSTAKGNHIFIPEKGEPMVGKTLTLAKAQADAVIAKAVGPEGDFDHDTGKGTDVLKFKTPVTHANWKEKWKSIGKAIGHTLVHPFVVAAKLVSNKAYRKEVGDDLKTAVKKEIKQSGKMADTMKRALKGEKISADDKKQAIHQLTDIIKVGLAAALITHLAAGGIGHLIATVASPIDEVVGIALDKPIRMASTKAFGVEHGLLPSSFYEGVEDVDALIDKLVDTIMDELAAMPAPEEA